MVAMLGTLHNQAGIKAGGTALGPHKAGMAMAWTFLLSSEVSVAAFVGMMMAGPSRSDWGTSASTSIAILDIHVVGVVIGDVSVTAFIGTAMAASSSIMILEIHVVGVTIVGTGLVRIGKGRGDAAGKNCIAAQSTRPTC